MFSRWDFKNLLEDGYVDIIQPDLSHAGGLSECKKIAAMAEAYDVAVAPHDRGVRSVRYWVEIRNYRQEN
jgi:galactonate dehydratase